LRVINFRHFFLGEAIGVFEAAIFLAKVTIRRPLRTCVLAFTLNALPMLMLATWVTPWGSRSRSSWRAWG